jgi:uncharacterized damage-inducible protein DinB
MTVADLEVLFDYGYWANGRIFEILARMTPEEFTRTVAGSYGSVRSTLVHVLSAEWGWLDRCGGAPRGPALVASDYPTVAALVDRWSEVEKNVRAFLSELRNQDLDRTVEFALGAGPKQAMPLGALLHHAALHGIHHRGQAALLLRSLGHPAGNFDLLLYHARLRAPGAA